MNQIPNAQIQAVDTEDILNAAMLCREHRMNAVVQARGFRAALRELERDDTVVAVMKYLAAQEGEYRFLQMPSASLYGAGIRQQDQRTMVGRILDFVQNPLLIHGSVRALELTPNGFRITRDGNNGRMYPNAMMTTRNILEITSNGVTVGDIKTQIESFAQAIVDKQVQKDDTRAQFRYPGRKTQLDIRSER